MNKKYMVQYCVGYLGFGVNEYARESFNDEEAANKRAAELKAENYTEIVVFPYENK